MNREEIKQILPHREPMLLIDHAELVDGVSIASYEVRGDEFFLQGHFPENPVVPGVILCEMMAQSACLLVDKKDGSYTPYYTGMDKIRFKRKVYPNDLIVFTCEIIKHKGIFYFVKGVGRVNNEVCVSGEFSFALVKDGE